MSDRQELLLELVARRRESVRQGHPIPTEELCAGCPEMVPQLERLLRLQRVLEPSAECRDMVHQLEQQHPPQNYPGLGPPQDEGELGRLDGYRILKVLGRGGMGIVFEAEDVRLCRSVALKMMLPEVATRPEARGRFLREARAAAAVKHDHVVIIYQVGEDRGIPYLAMEFLEGEPLDRRLEREKRLPLAEVLRIGRETAEGLAAAHEKKLIHRDIKPANIWLDTTANDRVKVLDFGLARPQQTDNQLTGSGAVVGTPGYMPPEQINGNPEVRSDLYSLGVVLYRLLAGRLPFDQEDMLALMMAVANEQPPNLAELEPQTPPALAEVVMQLLEKKPEDRPASALVVAERLAAIERNLLARAPALTARSGHDAAEADPDARLAGSHQEDKPPLSQVALSVGLQGVQVRFPGDFSNWTRARQRQVMTAILQLVGVPASEVFVAGLSEGSVLLTLGLAPEHAEALLRAVKRGALAALGATEAKFVGLSAQSGRLPTVAEWQEEVEKLLQDLLERWHESVHHGRGLSAAELCRDCPWLIGELEQHIRSQGGLGWHAAGGFVPREALDQRAFTKTSRTYRAFVSSTFVDLKEHRRCVIEALRRGGIQVDPMEEWTADSDEPKVFSQKRLDGCDLCVLLVGLRRGFVPPREMLSITQMEYEEARRLGMEVLVYLLFEEGEVKSGEYVWKRGWDEWEKDEQLRAWREKLRLEHGCGTFGKDPEPLGEMVLAAVSRWLQKQVGTVSARKAELAPLDFTSFLEEKRRHFIGRVWLFDEIESWSVRGSERALLIKGDPGAGKSAIVAELVARNPGGRVLAYHCCQANVSDTLHPGGFVRNLVALLISRVAGFSSRLAAPGVAEALADAEADPVVAFRRAVLDPLTPAEGEKPPVRYLVIDALDEALAHKGGMNIVDVLVNEVERLPRGIRILATTRKEREVLTRLSGLRALELDAQRAENRRDIEAYIGLRLKEPALAKRLDRSTQSAAAVQRFLASRSAGNFLYVQQALQGIERDLHSFDRLEQLPPGLGGLYLSFFERYFPTAASYENARRVLEVTAAAGEPLPEVQIAQATGLDSRAVIPETLTRLASFLPGRDGRHALYHQSLADWLKGEESRPTYHIELREGHRRLAEYCDREAGAGEPEDLARKSPYAIRYRAVHLMEEGATVGRFRPLVTQRWYNVRLALDGTGVGYLADVEHAWRAAERSVSEALRRGDPAEDLDLEIQCALCWASVQEVMRNVPEGLMRELVKRGIWTVALGLARANQIAQPRQRAQTLLFLAAQCSSATRLGLLRETANLLPQLPPSQERDGICRDLAERFHEAGFAQEAREAGLQIEEQESRNRTLAIIGRAEEIVDPAQGIKHLLTLGRTEEALCLTRNLTDAEQMGELLLRVGELTRKMAESERQDVLLRLGEVARELDDLNCKTGLLHQLGELAAEIGDQQRKAKLLSRLGQAAREIGDPACKARLLLSLGYAEEALAVASQLSDRERKVALLLDLGLQEEALAAAREVATPLQSAVLLARLVHEAHKLIDPVRKIVLLLELGQVKEALTAADKLSAPERKATLLLRIRQMAGEVAEPADKAELLLRLGAHEVALAAARAVLLLRIRQMAGEVAEPADKADLLLCLRVHEEALAAARAVADPERKADLLLRLGAHEEALAAARAVADPERKATLLFQLGQREESLATAREVAEPKQKATLLLVIGQVEEALAAAREVSHPEGNTEFLLALRRAARQVADPALKAEVLLQLSQLQLGTHEEAVEAAREADHRAHEADLLLRIKQQEVLAKLAALAREAGHPAGEANPLLRLRAREELAALAASHEEELAALAARKAGDSLRLGAHEEALAAARAVADPASKADLLLRLGAHEEALAAARAVADPERKAGLLSRLGQVARELPDSGRKADLLLQLGHQEEALAAARQASNIAHKADLLLRLGRRQEALAAARLVSDPEQMPRKVDLLLQLGDSEAALAAARKVSDSTGKAELLLQLGQPEEALAVARLVDSPTSHTRHAQLLLQLGQAEEAMAAARYVRDPAQKVELQQQVGQAARELADPARKASLLLQLGQQEEALAAARQVADPARKAELLSRLGHQDAALELLDKVSFPADPRAVSLSLGEVMRDFVAKGNPELALRALGKLPANPALDAVRLRSLVGISSEISLEDLPRLIEETNRITSPTDRARVCATLGNSAHEQGLAPVRQALLALRDPEAVAAGLTCLARRCALLGCIEEALAALQVLPRRRKDQVLVDLLASPDLSLSSSEANRLRLAAREVRDVYLAARGFAALAERLVEQGKSSLAWEIVAEDLRTLCEGAGESLEEEWTNALVVVIPTLAAEHRTQALLLAQALKGDRERTRVVEALAPHLGDEELKVALRLLQTIADEGETGLFLVELARETADCALLEDCVRRVLRLSWPEQAPMLRRLVPALSEDLLRQVQKAVEATPDGSLLYTPRTDVLTEIAVRLACVKQVDAALALARRLPGEPSDPESPRVRCLLRLVPALSEVGSLNDLESMLDSLVDPARISVLLEVAAHLPVEALPHRLASRCSLRELLQAVRGIPSSSTRLGAFRALAPHLTEEVIPDALTVLAGFPAQEERIRALAALAPRLSGATLQQARERAQAIALPVPKTKALIALAQHEYASELEKRLTAARELPNLTDRVEWLTALAEHLSGRLQRFAQECAVAAFRQMHDPTERLSVIGLLPFDAVASDLGLTLESAINLPYGLQRRAILERLAAWLTRLPPSDLHQVWQSALPVLAQRSRRELLADVTAMLSSVVRLGNRGCWVNVSNALLRVREWWP
jgi:predicted Ser/Thr protein kinase